MCYNSLKGKLENPAIGIDVLGVINPNNIDDCVIEDSNGLKQTWQWPPEAAAFGFWNKRSSPNSCDPTPHEKRNFEKTKWEEKDAVLQHSKSKLPIFIASTFWQLLFVIFRLQQEIHNVIPFSTLQFSPRKSNTTKVPEKETSEFQKWSQNNPTQASYSGYIPVPSRRNYTSK